MKSTYKDEISSLRRKYEKNQLRINELKEELAHELKRNHEVEEIASRLEKNINIQMLDNKTLEKQCRNLQIKLESKKSLAEPEKVQIKNLTSFVKASQSIFTAKAFINLENEPHKQEILQGRAGEMLMEIAKISERVVALKSNIADLKRAESDLKNLKSEEKNKHKTEIANEMKKYKQNIVNVRYKNFSGINDSCDFPIIDHLGSKLIFAQLLENACRYWNVSEMSHVLMDEEFVLWPGSKIVENEIKDGWKEVWLMMKEEANYIKATRDKDKMQEQDLKAEDFAQGNEAKAEELSQKSELDASALTSHIPSDVSEISSDDTEKSKDKHDKKERKKEKDKEKEKEKENEIIKLRHKNVLNLLIYILFIAAYTWSLIQSNKVELTFLTREGLNSLFFMTNFPVDSSSLVTFDSINLFQDFSYYLNEVFINAAFQSETYININFTENERKYVNQCYKKVGPVRFLQKRVVTKNCTNEFSPNLGREDLKCYKDFSKSNEATEDLTIKEIDDSWKKYQKFDSPRSVKGVLTSYYLDGYVANINSSMSASEASEYIKLIINKWIDLDTRALVVDMNFCNYNSDMCLSLGILFEFIAGGGVLATKNIQSFRVNLIWTSADKIRVAFDLIVGIIIIYFLVDFAIKMKKNGVKNSLKNFWNLLLLLMACMLISQQISFISYQSMDDIKKFDDENTEFVDYMSDASLYNLISNFTGVSSFTVYFFVLSFFQDSKSLKVIWGTLGQAMYRLLFFFLVFLLVFLGWMLLAYKGYGQYLYNYRDIGNTASTLLQMLLGNVNFDELYSIQPEFAGLFFFLFIFLNYFVMLNVFLAIINESYDTVYKEIKTSNDTDEMMAILGILLNGIRYCLITIPKNIITCVYCRRKCRQS